MRGLYFIALFWTIIINSECRVTNKMPYEDEKVLTNIGYNVRNKTNNSGKSEDGSFDAMKEGNGVTTVNGSSSFIGTDRKTDQVDYVADELSKPSVYKDQLIDDGYTFRFEKTNSTKKFETGKNQEENEVFILGDNGRYEFTSNENGSLPKVFENKTVLKIGTDVLGSLIGGNGLG